MSLLDDETRTATNPHGLTKNPYSPPRGLLRMKKVTATGMTRVTRMDYNAKGQLIATTAPNGATTQSSYDWQGNRNGSKRVVNGQTLESKVLEFDSAGRPKKTRDINGRITTNTYKDGRLTKSSRQGQNTLTPTTMSDGRSESPSLMVAMQSSITMPRATATQPPMNRAMSP